VVMFALSSPIGRANRATLEWWSARRYLFALVLALGAKTAMAQGVPTLPGQYARTDIEHGARIYGLQCASCHGPTGDLVPGVELRTGRLRRTSGVAQNPDANLRGIITTGIPGTPMPPFKLSDSELTMLVAYIRNMRDFDAQSVTLGDPSRGKTVFEGPGACMTCHRVNAKGSRLAPDLSDIGATRSADALQRALLDPTGSILPSNSVRAVTRDGRVVTGRRLNEDTHTVQLIDERERLVALVKADLREYMVNRESAMPSYKEKLSSQELADVIAYLLTLRGQ
jgi:putative heme-binding domain-containing protein